MKFLIGNWKSNKNFEETYQWFDTFAKAYTRIPDLTVIIAVPFLHLYEAQKKIKEHSLDIHLAAQDVSAYPYGAYTGAIPAQMLQGLVDFCIVGHSERREYFGESHLEIANKVNQLHQANITPVLCIDEPYAQKQIAALETNDVENLIVAYEPLEAIGTGHPAEPKHVDEVVNRISDIVANENVPIIYGGSTNDDNAKTYLDINKIEGLLPGGSSLKPDIFAKMAAQYQ